MEFASQEEGLQFNSSGLKECIESGGVFYCGGPGSYFFLGSSDCGKNFLLEHQIRQALNSGIWWNQVMVVSSTAAHSHQWKFLIQIFGKENVCFREHPDSILIEHAQRKKECEDMMKQFTEEEDYKNWMRTTQRLTIVDDQAGLVNLSNSTSNPYYNYVATNRHVYGYCCFLIQFRSNTGPGFIINSRAILSFAGDDESIKKIFNNLSYPKFKEEKDKIAEWCSQDYNWILFLNKLKCVGKRPKFPVFVEKVQKNKQIKCFYY